jgi:transposase
LGSTRPALISLLSLSMISAGVFLGTPTPNQVLAPTRYQSGDIDRTGGISRCGDEMMRAMLYEAAQVMLIRTTKWSWLKAWAMKIAKNRGMKKAIVALARRLAVIMHRIWIDGTEFRWTKEVAVA